MSSPSGAPWQLPTVTVFIENPAGSRVKHHYDERRLVLERVSAVSRAYPYPYGFILDTEAADGDSLDCFVLSERRFITGDILECVVLGLMEQLEDGVVDHNVIAYPVNQPAALDPGVQEVLREFVTHVFEPIGSGPGLTPPPHAANLSVKARAAKHPPSQPQPLAGKVVRPGRFLDVSAAWRHLEECAVGRHRRSGA